MKRFLCLAAFLALLVLGGCSDADNSSADSDAANQSEPIRLTYANFPPAFTVPCVQMERWKTEVEKRSNGQVLVETFPGGTLLKAKNMLRGVVEGQADIGCVGMSYLPGVFPACSAVELPLGFESSRSSSRTLWALFDKYRPEELQDVKVLTMFATPPSNIMSREPIRGLADLQGKEMRGSGSSSRFLDAMGAVSVSMPMPEVPDALQKNMVQGIFTSLEVLQDMKFAEFCPSATIVDGPVYLFAVVMNKDRWDALPPATQQMLDELAPDQADWTGQYWDAHTAEAMEWARAEHGLQVFALSEEDRATASAQAADMFTDWTQAASKAGLPAEDILQDVRAWKQQFEQ